MVDAAGFDEFYERHYPGVRRSLAVALGDVGAAEEAAQEAFVKAWLRWRRVASMERPEGWIYVVAVRRALRHRARTTGRERSSNRGGEYVACDPASAVTDRLVANQALAGLTPRQRLAVVLRYHADLSLAEVADAMGCAVGTVKSTLHTALERLRTEVVSTEVSDGTA